MFKSSDASYWKPTYFNNILLILGIGYSLHFNCLFIFLKSRIKRTLFVLGLGFENDDNDHFGSFSPSRTPSRTKFPTYFLYIFFVYRRYWIWYWTYRLRILFEILSLLYLFSRCQVFHQTTLLFFVIISAIHYVVILSYVVIDFSWPYLNLPFSIQYLKLHIILSKRTDH